MDKEDESKFRDLVTLRLTDARQVILDSLDKISGLTEEQAQNLMAIAVNYFNACPAGVMGKSLLKTSDDFYLMNLLVAAYFCKSADQLLKKGPPKEEGPKLIY